MIEFASVERIWRESFSAALRPDPDLKVWEWADRYRVLEFANESGPWRTSRVPAMRDVMEALSPSDPATEVTLVAGTQNGKTESGNNFIGFVIDLAPGPAMMLMPTSNTGKRSGQLRLAPMIDSTPRLREKITNATRDGSNSQTLKQFPGGYLVIAGANSAAEIASLPIRYLFMDEVDKYPDDVDGEGPADRLAEKRTETYKTRRKIYRCGSPVKEGESKLWAHYLRGDQRRRYVPCPFCGAEQVLRWEQFRWLMKKSFERVDSESGEVAEVAADAPGAVEREKAEVDRVWYECESCEAEIEEHHKTEMFERARWVKGNPDSPRASFHLPSFYSPVGWKSWREVVEEKLEADADPTEQLLKVWTNTVAGLPFVARSGLKAGIEDELVRRSISYARGTCHESSLVLSASVDVQADRLEVSVDGWGPGEESALVDYQQIFGDTETTRPWDDLDAYLRLTFPHPIGTRLGITATIIDASYRTQTVLAFCGLRADRHILAGRGLSVSGRAVLGLPNVLDVNHEGKKIEGGVKLWPIGTDTAKEKIYARLALEKPGPGFMHFPAGLPVEYFKGLVSERQTRKFVKGFLRLVWEKSPSARNEPLDLKVYSYAAAIYAGIMRMNWTAQRKALEARAAAEKAAAEAAKGREAVPFKRRPSPPRNWTTGWRH